MALRAQLRDVTRILIENQPAHRFYTERMKKAINNPDKDWVYGKKTTYGDVRDFTYCARLPRNVMEAWGFEEINIAPNASERSEAQSIYNEALSLVEISRKHGS